MWVVYHSTVEKLAALATKVVYRSTVENLAALATKVVYHSTVEKLAALATKALYKGLTATVYAFDGSPRLSPCGQNTGAV